MSETVPETAEAEPDRLDPPRRVRRLLTGKAKRAFLEPAVWELIAYAERLEQDVGRVAPLYNALAGIIDRRASSIVGSALRAIQAGGEE